MKLTPILFGISLAITGTGIAVAQDSTPTKPPAVLQITREWLKPGKTGMVHDKSEAAFVAAMNKGKLQGHYVALNSMTGKARAIFITRYPSFEAWEADNKLVAKDASLSAELDRDSEADGALLDGLDQAVYTYDEELSYHPHSDIAHARYYEITVFHVRPGHRKDWYDVTKAYKEANDKAGTTAHWATYEVAYGGEGGTYISITARNTMSEIDTAAVEGKKISDALGGQDGMRKLDESFWAAIDSVHTELFSVNSKQSYPEEAWIKGDPDFWKPKAAAPKAEAAAKPASAAATKPASR
jgi:hypothetical protein